MMFDDYWLIIDIDDDDDDDDDEYVLAGCFDASTIGCCSVHFDSYEHPSALSKQNLPHSVIGGYSTHLDQFG